MNNLRKKDLKKLLKKFDQETIFYSSTTMIFENRNFQKLINIINKSNTKEKFLLFKVIKSQLEKNVFVFKLLETITGEKTQIEEKDYGRMNVILKYWKQKSYNL